MSEQKDYAIGQKIVHWLMALLILVDLTVAQQFGGEMELDDRLQARVGHASIGIIILTLFIIRVVLRLRNGAPQFPDDMPGWQKSLASLTHIGFYVLLFVVIATGLLAAGNATDPISAFGALDLAVLGNSSAEQFQNVRMFHELSTKTLIALIALHLLAAVYHLLFLRDGRVTRMLQVWKRAT